MDTQQMQIVCDFYNLHLKSGKKYITTLPAGQEFFPASEELFQDTFRMYEPIWPDEDEQKRILNFFRQYRTYVLPENENVDSLQEYKRRTGKKWFYSEDYINFANHWLVLKRLIDGIVKNQLHILLFEWFRDYALQWERNLGYTLNIGLIDPQGKVAKPEQLHQKAVPLDSWRVVEAHKITGVRYGINIGYLLYKIHRSLIDVMKNPKAIRRCVISTCGNTFLTITEKGRPREKYCSDSCWNRYKNEYNKLYMKYIQRPRKKGQPVKDGEWVKKEALKHLQMSSRTVSRPELSFRLHRNQDGYLDFLEQPNEKQG